MASFSTNSTTLKVILISSGVLTVALALKHTLVPIFSDLTVSEFPSFWTFFLTCTRPPYLYILMNFIIVTIFASSKLHQHHHRHSLHHPPSPDDNPVFFPPPVHPLTPPVTISEYLPTVVFPPPSQNLMQEQISVSGDVRTAYAVSDGVVSEAQVYEEPKMPKQLEDIKEVVKNDSHEANIHVRTGIEREDSLDFSFLNWNNEKPPVSARFAHHRKSSLKPNPEGGKVGLGVMKGKKHHQETLESTWKMITEGRHMPLTRHIKKSDTWDSYLRRNSPPLTDQNGGTAVKKSETFNGRVKARGENASPSQTQSSKLKKEPSLGQDELNRRVEAFINKFNQEMRLQREESLRQYHEMITRGAH